MNPIVVHQDLLAFFGIPMIVDHLSNWRTYQTAHPLFEAAFECLEHTDWSVVENGRFNITGEDVFGIVDRRRGKGVDNAVLEIHRRYIDIQFLITGNDVMGYRPLIQCSQHQPFNDEKDIGFLDDRPISWVDVGRSCFAIFYPQDAHAPMGTSEDFHKVVIKVRR